MPISLSLPLILASASPRRKELLRLAGLPFKVKPAQVDEAARRGETPQDHVRRLSLEKAHAVAMENPASVVLGADTIVVIDGIILGKPENKKQAREMLRKLSNRSHTVFTGYTLSCVAEKICRTGIARSCVRFKNIEPEEINWYINTNEPYDKAGGYAAQGQGAAFIRSISGSYTNVIGLPLANVLDMLKKMNVLRYT
ncbi:MAG: Maf family protein [Smithellaceae bacterium]|nr:Maf family protein [Smithellaceae bacterium]HQF84467.1 Maf family protein [Smithellaceae bacterium]HQG80773.1 Maf family protein [Smithellaceae bacterium]